MAQIATALEFLRRFGPARLAAMGVVSLLLIGFFAVIILRMSQPPMALLYADLPMAETAAIVRDLDTRGVRTELRGDGTAIYAPKTEIARLRMELAAKSLPSAGGVGYEIFDKGDPFGASRDLIGINHVRALEGELSRTIRSLARVQAARVHLVIPERKLFDRDRELPRASIVLRTRGGMDAPQVRAIRHLVASAVNGLKPERIAVVDESGRLLADGAAEGDAGLAQLDDRKTALERRLRAQIEDIVASVVGRGRAQVQVAADFDMNRLQQTSETYDPESRVIRSTQTRSETSQTTEPASASVSVATELPGGRDAAGRDGAREAANKADETVNYEISRTTRTETHEPGRIRRLSVAVVVDGVYRRAPGAAPASEPAYAPRAPEELERIAALVRSAVGFDKARGDQVEIVNLRFADPPAVIAVGETGLLAEFMPTRDDLFRMIELAVLGLLCLIVLVFVVRPLMRRVLGPEAFPVLDSMTASMGGRSALTGPTRAALPAPGTGAEDDASARITALVREKPQAAAELVRDWLKEGVR